MEMAAGACGMVKLKEISPFVVLPDHTTQFDEPSMSRAVTAPPIALKPVPATRTEVPGGPEVGEACATAIGSHAKTVTAEAASAMTASVSADAFRVETPWPAKRTRVISTALRGATAARACCHSRPPPVGCPRYSRVIGW